MGPSGSSFTIMLNLVNHLPLMICPSWTSTLSNPVSVWDMISAMLYCLGNQDTYSQIYDIGGSTTLSYRDILITLATNLSQRTFFISVPFCSPALSKLWVSTITGAPKALVYPLVGSLKTHMVPSSHHRLDIPNYNWMSFEESIDKILADTNAIKVKPNAFQNTDNIKGNQVRSIQRLETLFRFNAHEVAMLYFKWLPNFYSPFIKVDIVENVIFFKFWFLKIPLLVLEHKEDISTDSYQVFFIKRSLLCLGLGKGRLTFRNIIDLRYTMAEIHDFTPRLPWFIYKFTQAKMHLFTMKAFNRYLLNVRKD